MKATAEFLKVLIFAGLVVLLPISPMGIGLEKAAGVAVSIAGPLAVRLAGNTRFATPILLVLVLSASFLTGLLVKTGFGRWAVGGLERLVSEPGDVTRTIPAVSPLW